MDNNYGMAGGAAPSQPAQGAQNWQTQSSSMPPMSPVRHKSMVEPRKPPIVLQPERKVWYWWVIGLLAMAVLALAGVLIWQMLSKANEVVDDPSAALQQENENLKAELQHDKDAREIVGILQGVVEERLKQAAGDTQYVPLTIWTVYDNAMPEYQPEGMLVKMPLTRAYGFRIDNADDAVLRDTLMSEDLAGKLIGVLEGRGYSLYDEILGTRDYLNEQTGIICGLSMNSVPFVVSCGYTGWISQDTAERELLNSLAEAYRKNQGEYPARLYASAQNIHNSSRAPYQTITTGLQGAAGLFYRKGEDGDWKFFAGAQAVLSCKLYETEEEQKAFADEVCYDEAKQQNIPVGDLLYVQE